MNTKKVPKMIAASLAAILILGTGCASNKAAPADTQAHSDMMDKNSMMGNGMMNNGAMVGQMDMNQMMGMMNQCMTMNKNGKTCDNQIMEKCQKNMDKQECTKMMTDVKEQSKTDKKQ